MILGVKESEGLGRFGYQPEGDGASVTSAGGQAAMSTCQTDNLQKCKK